MPQDPYYIGVYSLLFLGTLGVVLQLLGLVEGGLALTKDIFVQSSYITSSESVVQYAQNPNLFPSSVLVKILADFILTTLAIIAAYYAFSLGINMIGIITGKGTIVVGVDLPIVIKLVALGFIYSFIFPVFKILTLLTTLGALGYVISTFIILLAFISGWGFIASQVR